MRNYVNARDREVMAVVAFAEEGMQEILRNLEMPPECRKWLKTSTTFMEKWYRAMLHHIGEKEGHKVRRLVDDNYLMLQTKPVKGTANTAKLVIGYEQAVGIAIELLDKHCVGCDGCKEECFVHEFLEALNIPKVSSEDNCIYQTPRRK